MLGCVTESEIAPSYSNRHVVAIGASGLKNDHYRFGEWEGLQAVGVKPALFITTEDLNISKSVEELYFPQCVIHLVTICIVKIPHEDMPPIVKDRVNSPNAEGAMQAPIDSPVAIPFAKSHPNSLLLHQVC